MKARHLYLTLIGNRPTLNLVLANDKETEVMSIELSESHLSNLVQDGITMALRPDKRRPVWRETMR